MSKLYIIAYNLVVEIFYIIYLHFIKNKYIILALLVILAKEIIQPIYDNKFLLLTNNKL